jgi:hypothetical protein
MVDFDKVRENAQKEGISLQEIAIVYKDLTFLELEALKRVGGYVSESDNAVVLGRFIADGTVLFPEKATSVLYLGA